MKVIVTGATGFLGQHLVAYLEKQACNVLALGRNQLIGQQLEHGQVYFKSVDITDREALLNAFEQADVVFHCAAKSSDWGSEEEFYQTNVIGTENVVACAGEYGIKRIVYISSTSVYFDFNDKLNVGEEDLLPSRFANAYAKTKYLGECIILDQSYAEAVIIRPRGIFGEGDQAIMPRILQLAKRKKLPLINEGSALIDITYVKNLCEALYLAAIKPGVGGEVFNISNDEPIRLKEVLDLVLSGIGVEVR